MSLPALPLGDRFCVSINGGTRGGWWVHLQGVISIAVSGLGFRKALVGTGWAVSFLLCMTGIRKQSSHFVRPLFLELKAGQAAVDQECILLRS